MAASTAQELYLVPRKLNVAELNATSAFKNLSAEEKRYAHHLSRAAFAGARACLQQTSPESPDIFALATSIFADGCEQAKERAASSGLTPEEIEDIANYFAQFFGNMGNYLSFGDTKFIPRVAADKLATFVQACGNSGDVEQFSRVRDRMYSTRDQELLLGFPVSAGGNAVSTYYIGDVSRSDMDLVQRFLSSQNQLAYNTRLERSGSDLIIRVASADPWETTHDFEGRKIIVRGGDYASEMNQVARSLESAAESAANETQRKFLTLYAKSFQSGDINAHVEGSAAWVADKGPVVETYIGFIESYRDPYGVRGEFEGFVAMVNKEMSAKFATLVNNAENLLPSLPWPATFEKDTFLRPDFTSLDVLSFAGSGIPAGINIPNYDDVRQNVGFKNVSLGNVLAAPESSDRITFLGDNDQEIFRAVQAEAFELQVGGHELLGHGSGKLFCEDGDGKFNFDREQTMNPLTGKPPQSWYRPGETYDSVFLDIGSSLEECRAECVGLLLSANTDVLRVFGHENEKAEDVMYVNWLLMCRAGLVALEFYSPEQTKWRQAHMQARYGILTTLLRAGQGLVALEGEGETLSVRLDRTKIRSVGVPAIRDFLLKIQVYKSTADVASARSLYNDVTAVRDDNLERRDTVLRLKKPRKLFVQPFTQLAEDGSVSLQTFPATPAGLIDSFVSHYKEV